MHFGANYLSPLQFDTVHWLQTQRLEQAPVWYYWITRSTPHQGSLVDLTTVDPLLVPLVTAAQKKGILTLPSCEGHFVDLVDLNEQYRWLIAEEQALQQGLDLKDVESQRHVKIRIPGWRAPKKEDLDRLLRMYQGVGRVGFAFRDLEQAHRIAQAAKASCRVDLEKRSPVTVVSLSLRGRSANDLRDRWTHLQRIVIPLL